MDVPEQEVVRQGVGDAGERIGNKIEVIQVADGGGATQTQAVNLYRDTTRQRPAGDIVAGEFPKAAQGAVSIGSRQETFKDHISLISSHFVTSAVTFVSCAT